jgi:hypothetical protein
MSACKAFSRWSAIAAIFALYGLVGALSHAVRSDLTLLPYLLPLGLTLYNFGPPAAYASCPPAALAWLTLHPPFVYPSLPSPWAALGLSLFFALFTLLATRQQRRSRHIRDQLRHLSTLLPLCSNCGQVLCHDGQWRSFEQLLLNPRLTSPLPHHPCSIPSTAPHR